MRVIFYNLHTNGFYVSTFQDIIFRRKVSTKHKYLIDYLMSKNIKLCCFISKKGSTIPFPFNKIFKGKIIRFLECLYVFKKNRFPLKMIEIITSPSKIKDDDIILIYPHCTDIFEDFPITTGKKICHLIHFYGTPDETKWIKSVDCGSYLFDVQLDKYSLLFKKNLLPDFHAKYITHPMIFENRFISKKTFAERKNKCLAIGTITFCENQDFIDTYGDSCYQPHRKMIYEHSNELKKYIDNYTSFYNETPLKKVSSSERFLSKVFKYFYNIKNAGQQKNYFSFNIVEKYNEYRMFICPEDVNGDYGIGTIEGMACGCAMIGINSGIFEDIGLVSGVHYISYNGTLDDLKEKISYWQKEENQKRLSEIAETGYLFIRDNFNKVVVCSNLYKEFQKLD
ncbi:glycosyltransferase family 1 protein [Treponema socranskii]|uniref:glycosyltransferase n=1 Tax=Treponema socranskii TaxID=53419 RepID=UPI003D8E32EC